MPSVQSGHIFVQGCLCLEVQLWSSVGLHRTSFCPVIGRNVTVVSQDQCFPNSGLADGGLLQFRDFDLVPLVTR